MAEFLGYGPVLSPEEAGKLGWPGEAPGRVALGPEGLRADPAGVVLPVLDVKPGRGRHEVTVRLPNGALADLGATELPGADLAVRIDPDGCAVLPG